MAITVWGMELAADERHFIPDPYIERYDMQELRRLRELPELSSLSLCDIPLDDVGLGYICDCPGLDKLALQNTALSNEGLRELGRLPKLAHLRLKDNRQLDDRCAPHLAALGELVDLQLHETSIGREGLALLVGLSELRDLLVSLDEARLTRDDLLALSARMPRCSILVKGVGSFEAGALRA